MKRQDGRSLNTRCVKIEAFFTTGLYTSPQVLVPFFPTFLFSFKILFFSLRQQQNLHPKTAKKKNVWPQLKDIPAAEEVCRGHHALRAAQEGLGAAGLAGRGAQRERTETRERETLVIFRLKQAQLFSPSSSQSCAAAARAVAPPYFASSSGSSARDLFFIFSGVRFRPRCMPA